MADVFISQDVRKIMRGKKVLFLGDSILRNIYQDLLWIMEKGTLTPAELLKKKGTMIERFCGDKLVPGTGNLITGRDYWEVREYPENDKLVTGTEVTYVFLTKCYSPKLESFLQEYKETRSPPDVILVLSALWDINRWGPEGIDEYLDNCPRLLRLLTASFPPSSQVIWLTSPPISVEVMGGFLLEGLEFQTQSMRFNVMEANQMVANAAASYGHDVIDMHYWMLHQIHKRTPDGIHWSSDAVRLQLNIILTHFCMSRDLKLPGRWGGARNRPLETVQNFAKVAEVGPVRVVADSGSRKRKKYEIEDSKKRRNNESDECITLQ